MKINYTFLSRKKIVPDLPDIDCAICLDNITDDEIKINCGHCFHMECLKNAIAVKNKCPCCRSTITKLNVNVNINENGKESIDSQINRLKENMMNLLEKLINNHTMISLTVGLPVFYTMIILCLLVSSIHRVIGLIVK